MQIPITDYMKSVRRFILYLVDTLSRYLLRERNISFDKNNTKNPILTLKLTIRKETYSSILSKSVSCYCYFSINNGIFHSQGRLDTFEVLNGIINSKTFFDNHTQGFFRPILQFFS